MKFILATGIFPPEIGGPAIVIEALARDLRQAGHEVTLVTYGSIDEITGDVVRVARTGSAFQRYVRLMRAVRSRLASGATVMATDVFSVGIPTRLALIGKRNPFVVRLGGEWCWEAAVTKGGLRVTLRDFWETQSKTWLMRLKRWNYHWILGRAARVIVTSDLLSDVLRPLVPRVASRFVTVPNVMVGETTHCRAEEGVHLPLRLIYIGRFAPVKNLPFLSRVLKKAVERGMSLACTFVGDGMDFEASKDILRDVPGMTFLGSLSHSESMKLLSQSDVHVLPSLSDICPNTAVEALASGVPCLMTREHGLPRPLGGVMEVHPQDEDAWIEAFKQLSDHVVYAQLRASIQLPQNGSQTLVDVVRGFAQPMTGRCALLVGYGADLLDPQASAHQRVASLADRGFRVTSLVLSGVSRDREIYYGSYGVIGFSGFSLRRMWRAVRRGIDEMRSWQGRGLVSAQDPFVAGLVGYAIARFSGSRFEIQEHGDFFSGWWERESFSHRCWAIVGRCLLRHADHVRVVSERVKEHVVRIGIDDRLIDVIPVAQDLGPLFDRQIAPRETSRPFRFVAPCRFVHQKGLDLLVRAMYRLRQDGVPCSLEFIGSGPLESALRTQVISFGLAQDIHFSSWRPMHELWNDADALVLPSRYEGWARTVVEAMAAGVPVVMSEVGCAGSFARPDTDVLIVPINDVPALAAAMRQIVEQPDQARQMAERARERARMFLSLEELHTRQREAWMRCIAKPFHVLVALQAVDEDDPLNGFLVRWLMAFADRVPSVTVMALRVGRHTLPPNIRVIPFRPKGSRSRMRVIWTLLSVVWRHRRAYDAVFVRQDAQYVVFAGWLWRLLGKRVVFWFTHYRARTAWFWLAAGMSHEMVTAVPESNPVSSALKVGHHIDTDLFTDTGRTTSREPLRVLIFGRVSPVKRVAWIAHAMRSYLDEKKITLRIVGTATTTDAAKELRETISNPSIWEVRDVTYEEAPALYREADIYINATPGSMDKTIIEAAASGCIVLASTGGLIRGLPSELHWLQVTTQEEVRAALERITRLSAAERQYIGAQLRAWAMRHHSLQANVARIASLLREPTPRVSIRQEIKRGIRALAGLRPPNGVRVIMFHSMDGKGSAGWDLDRLRALILRLSSAGYCFTRFADLWGGKAWQLPMSEKSVVLTFDDATEDILEAAKVLKEFDVPAVVFAPSDIVSLTASDGIERQIVSVDELRQLVTQGMEIGGHGKTHVELPRCDAVALRDEIASSHAYVKMLSQSGTPFTFAYPRGKHSLLVAQAVREGGFLAAFTVKPGVWSDTTNAFYIPRLPVLRWMSSRDVVAECRAGW